MIKYRTPARVVEYRPPCLFTESVRAAQEAMRVSGWKAVAANGSYGTPPYLEVARVPPLPNVFLAEPTLPASTIVRSDRLEVKAWALKTSIFLEGAYRDIETSTAYLLTKMFGGHLLRCSHGPRAGWTRWEYPPQQVIQDPACARKILRARGSTNAHIKRMPMRAMKRSAERAVNAPRRVEKHGLHWSVDLLLCHAAFDPETLTMYVFVSDKLPRSEGLAALAWYGWRTGLDV